MDIHKPKPFHNLRELASEVLVIVIGVAIALTGEQAVEWLSWQHKAEAARNSIALELGEDVGQGEERVRVGPCYAAELDRLARTIDDAAATGKLLPMGAIRTAPWRTWDSDTWRNAQASGAAAHLGGDEQANMGGAFSLVAALRETNEAERDQWARLSTLAGPGRAFRADEAPVMRFAVAQARHLNGQMVLTGIRLRQAIDLTHLRFGAQQEHDYDSPVAGDVCALAGASVMEAGAVPPDYGGRMNSADLQTLIEKARVTAPLAVAPPPSADARHGHP